MGIGVSIFLLAVGAILTFATNIEVSGLDLDAVGVILMLAGVVGIALVPGGVRAAEQAHRSC